MERRHPWYDSWWPLLAGIVGAVGILACDQAIGLFGTVAAFTLMVLTVGPTAWSILSDMRRPSRSAILEVAPASGLATVAMIGLTSAVGGWSVALLLVVAAGSPPARGLVHATSRRFSKSSSSRSIRDSDVRRRFDEIVGYGFGVADADD
jgi:uncharacterized membrane protein